MFNKIQKLRMKSLWLGSLCIGIFCVACSPAKLSKCTEAPANGLVFENYFDSTNTPIRYKADINVYGRFFSGIIFVKYFNDTTCQVAFTTMPGTKLFEMQLTPHTDTIYECLEKMNRPAVLKAIKKNIRIFAMLDDFTGTEQSFAKKDFNGILWRKTTPVSLYQYYQPEGGAINKIELMSKSFNKRITLDVNAFNGKIPSDVQIHNFNYKLDIHLTQL